MWAHQKDAAATGAKIVSSFTMSKQSNVDGPRAQETIQALVESLHRHLYSAVLHLPAFR